MEDQQKAKSTVNNRLSSIKAYLNYVAAKDVTLQQVQLNISEVPFLKVSKKIRPIIEDNNTLQALLDAPPNTNVGCRDVMIFSVLFDTMIRVDELIQLDIKDVQIEAEIPFMLIHGKGNKERTVPFSPEVIPLIKAYLAEYHGDKVSRNQPFIYTKQHETIHRMSERNVERVVKKYADKIRADHPDIPSTVYPHMLRRTRGTGLYRDGVAMEAIAVAMGHASIRPQKIIMLFLL